MSAKKDGQQKLPINTSTWQAKPAGGRLTWNTRRYTTARQTAQLSNQPLENSYLRYGSAKVALNEAGASRVTDPLLVRSRLPPDLTDYALLFEYPARTLPQACIPVLCDCIWTPGTFCVYEPSRGDSRPYTGTSVGIMQQHLHLDRHHVRRDSSIFGTPSNRVGPAHPYRSKAPPHKAGRSEAKRKEGQKEKMQLAPKSS